MHKEYIRGRGDDIIKNTQKNLIHKHERRYFVLALLASILTYISLACTLIGLVYLAIFLGISLFLHALMLGHIRTNGVRLNSEQFPEVYEKVKELCGKMDMKFVPDVYVLESSGALNAFAARFFGRNMVVLYSTIFELIEEGDEDELSFVIAHELAHIQRRHISRQLLVWPAMWIPGITQAYSRACEYTCDRLAAYYTGNSEAAQQALTMFGVGKMVSKKVNRTSYLKQIDDEKGFFVWLSELLATHPPLPKRIREIGLFMGDVAIEEVSVSSRASRKLWVWIPASLVLIGFVIGGGIYAVGKIGESLDAYMYEEEDLSTAPPIIDAVVNADYELANALIQEGTDFNVQDDVNGWTALHWAVKDADLEMSTLLVEAGADPNLGDYYNITPLMTAAADGNLDTVKLLIAAGADINAQDDDGWTALMYAVSGGHVDGAEALLQAGAEREIENYQEQTALMQAIQSGNQDIADMLRNP